MHIKFNIFFNTRQNYIHYLDGATFLAGCNCFSNSQHTWKNKTSIPQIKMSKSILSDSGCLSKVNVNTELKH